MDLFLGGIDSLFLKFLVAGISGFCASYLYVSPNQNNKKNVQNVYAKKKSSHHKAFISFEIRRDVLD